MGGEDNYIWDAAIVGAGPAGSIAALHLARRGHSVLLIDKEQFPRDKVCGDGLIADAIGALKRAGLYADVARLGYQTGTGTVYSPSRIRFDVEGEYLTLKRYVLDDLIKRKAEESGAVFLQSKITNVEPQPDRTIIITSDGDRRACQSANRDDSYGRERRACRAVGPRHRVSRVGRCAPLLRAVSSGDRPADHLL